MSLSDPVADYLTRIRNAFLRRHDKVDIPASQMKLEITKILKEEGYIQNYKVQEESKTGSHPDFLKVFRREICDHRIETGEQAGTAEFIRTRIKFQKLSGGLGISIVSTSRGIMTGDRDS